MGTRQSTPKQDGFRMPGEFEPHRGCWMLWPERTDTWRFGAKPAQYVFATVADTISQFEPTTVGVSRSQFLNARHMLADHIRVIEMSCDDSWMRDTGPTFVVDDKGNVRGVDWDFNAYGGLMKGIYFPWDQDDLVARKVLDIERIDRYKAKMVLEGGSIHVDGEGTLLVTEECLLHPNRNPQLTKNEIEKNLQEYLNVEKIIWLGAGVYLDEADGHIDNLCSFIRPGVVALTWTNDTLDPQYEISMDAYERLSDTTDAKGRHFEIHKIHQPDPLYLSKEESEGIDKIEDLKQRSVGDRLPASYINFYIANGGVIVPAFDSPYDHVALEALQKLFPDKKVVGLPGREILLGGGNIHCITQQQPRG